MTDNLNRRDFIKVLTGGSATLFCIPLPVRGHSATAAPAPVSDDWSVYINIHRDNTISMISPVMEMGQFMRTTGPMILAEEMDLDWSSITISREIPTLLKRGEDGGITYDHAPIGVGGSQAVKQNWVYMRKAGATVRRMLVEEAASRWQVDPDRLATEKNFVYDQGKSRRLSYGELAEAASQRRVNPEKVKLKSKDQYRIVGRDKGTVDIHDLVTGKPVFGIDEEYPGALQAVIERAPAIGAEILTYNKQAALDVPGVQAVIEIERNDDESWPEGRAQIVAAGIAVLADNLWSAMQGRKALNAKWKNNSAYAALDSEAEIKQFYQQVTGDADAELTRDDGDVKKAFADADIVLDQIYEKPLLAHACMEPLNCIVDIRKSDSTVIVGHQWPHAAAAEIERITGIDATNVEIKSKRMGGGFGRRGSSDFLREAIMLAHKAKRPVKITWMREDDSQRDFFGAAAVMRIRASLKDGKPTAWHHRQAHTRVKAEAKCFPAEVIKNFRVENIKSDSITPVGTWRGPKQLQWAFAAESMLDELAYAAERDPLAFRLDLMKPHKAHKFDYWAADVLDSGRMAKCYEAAASMANWSKARPAGTGLGIAGHFTFGSYVAFVIEVTVTDKNELRLNKAWGAIDCGFAVNPNHVRAQMEGGFIDGLNAALFNKGIIKDGEVQTRNFDTLRWMRARHAPREIEVEIIKNDHEPTGVGEPPTAPAPAALTNAIFAACGKRIRKLPIADNFTL